MTRPRIELLLPILRKELTELANRPRTYVWRILAVLALYGVGGYFLITELPGLRGAAAVHPMDLLGQGKRLFDLVSWMLVGCVVVFQPVMAAGAFAREKERGTIQALVLTDLRPTEMVAEKFSAAVLPMVSIVLIGAPLLGFCYTLGGVTAVEFFGMSWLLLVMCLQFGALGVLCSACCATTTGALICTFFAVALYYAIPLPLVVWVEGLLLAGGGSTRVGLSVWSTLCPFAAIDQLRTNWTTLLQVVLWTSPSVLSLPVILLIASRFVVSRAFVRPRNRMKDLWDGMDEFLNWANDEYAGGVALAKTARSFPELQPVAWRELTRGGQNALRYTLRMMLFLELPVIVVGSFILTGSTSGQDYGLTFMVVALWVLAALAVAVKGVNAIGSERVRENLEPLLTTPMRGDDILRQKLHGVRMLLLVFAAPFITLLVMECIAETNPMEGLIAEVLWQDRFDILKPLEFAVTGKLLYLGLSITCIYVYLSAFSWLGLWLGIRIRIRLRALLAALGIILTWNLLPLMALVAAEMHMVRSSPVFAWGAAALLTVGHAVCPILNIIILETDSHPLGWDEAGILVMILNCAVSYFLFWQLRHHCLTHADELLGRMPEPPETESIQKATSKHSRHT